VTKPALTVHVETEIEITETYGFLRQSNVVYNYDSLRINHFYFS